MRRIPSIWSFALSLLAQLVTPQARGEVEFWMSVGSYQDLAYAEVARNDASSMLAESFAIDDVETHDGFFYRVVAGPYFSKEIADHLVDEARRVGFATPWAFVRESGLTTLPSSTALREPELDLPELDVDSELEALPALELKDRPMQSSEHKLIDVAPDDYHLHRLRRDRSAVEDPG
jgi:hypothetical protein